MGKNWQSREFVAKDTVVGHGREEVAKKICAFLDEQNIHEGNAAICMLDGNNYPLLKEDPQVVGIVFYKK